MKVKLENLIDFTEWKKAEEDTERCRMETQEYSRDSHDCCGEQIYFCEYYDGRSLPLFRCPFLGEMLIVHGENGYVKRYKCR